MPRSGPICDEDFLVVVMEFTVMSMAMAGKKEPPITDRTAIRIFKQNLAKEPLFDAFFSRTEELFAAAMGTTREDLRMRSGFVHGKILGSLPAGSQLIWA